MIPSKFFQYIYHIGCAFNLHSIINSGLIPGGQNSSKRQTVCFLPVDPRDKSHKDPDEIDLNVPRRAQYLHNAWKRHQDAVYWVDINLAIEKRLTFYQTRSNAIIFQETLPANCIPKVVRLKTGEVLYEKVFMSPRPPPKISLKHEWERELGSEVARQPEGEVVRRGIYFIDPEDTEFKETIKNARKKLETSVAPAVPCKIMKNCGTGASNKIRQNLLVFWKLMNPQECVWEIRYRIIMKTMLQEKVKIHYSTTIGFTNLFLCLKL